MKSYLDVFAFIKRQTKYVKFISPIIVTLEISGDVSYMY